MKKNVYKVIRKKDRTSAIVGGYKDYSIKYIKSFETKAIPETLGIFCFKKRFDAERFIDKCDNFKRYEIIQVVPLGKPIIPKMISDAFGSEAIKRFYKNLDEWTFPPEGTVCYQSVLVLE